MGTRRGLVAPQNTFLENIIKRSNGQYSSFILANARIVGYPIVFANDGFCKMSGYARSEIMNQSSTLHFMWSDDTDPESCKQIEEALLNQQTLQIETLMIKKSRTPLWLALHIAPIRNEKDSVVLYLITFRDITLIKDPLSSDDSTKGLSKFAKLARSVNKNKSMLLNQSTDADKTSNLAIMSLDLLPQYRQETPKTPPHIILHYCFFKSTWDIIIILLTIYTALSVPYNVAFKAKTMDDVVLLVADSLVDVIFFLDVILNFHTTFVGTNGEVISEPRSVRMNYVKSWFLIDLISCLPYDVFNAFQHEEDGISSLFSALKVVRLLRLGRVARKLDQYLQHGAAFLVLYIAMFILFSHWFACFWFFIGNSDVKTYEYSWLNILAQRTDSPYVYNNVTGELSGGPSHDSAYYTAIYFTLSSMTSVGFGNVSAETDREKIFTCCLMLFGSLAYAMIFGNVTTIWQEMMSSLSSYHNMLNSIKDFMKLHEIPRELSERVLDYVQSTWVITKGIDTDRILGYCPKDMRGDISVHLNRQVFNEHASFRLASDGCLRALASDFNIVHSAPGDLLYHQGESLDQLCFVVSGSLEVIQNDEVVAILTKGDVFGDLFWEHSTIGQSAANVKTLTYCDIHIIKAERLYAILDFYQAFAASFKRNLQLTYNLRHRVQFRKLDDVRREEELAREGNQAEISKDHPVRKLLSRFQKRRTQNSLSTTNLTKTWSKEKDGKDVESGTADPSPTQNGDVTKTKWGLPANEGSPVRKANGDRTFSKWGKFMANGSKTSMNGVLSRPLTITELHEVTAGEPADETSEDHGSPKASDSSFSQLNQSMLKTLLDIRSDIKAEIGTLNSRLDRLDLQIEAVVNAVNRESARHHTTTPHGQVSASSIPSVETEETSFNSRGSSADPCEGQKSRPRSGRNNKTKVAPHTPIKSIRGPTKSEGGSNPFRSISDSTLLHASTDTTVTVLGSPRVLPNHKSESSIRKSQIDDLDML